MNKIVAFIGTIIIIFALLIGGGYYFINHQQNVSLANQKAYATAYEAHDLGEPFNLLSKDWTNNTWTYVYQSPSSVATSYELVKSQLSGGGYQVIASRPDTKDTIYRDLITGDVTVTAKISTTAAGGTGVQVTVTGIRK